MEIEVALLPSARRNAKVTLASLRVSHDGQGARVTASLGRHSGGGRALEPGGPALMVMAHVRCHRSGPSADAWLLEGEAEPDQGTSLTDELEYVSRRMAWSLQEGPSGSGDT